MDQEEEEEETGESPAVFYDIMIEKGVVLKVQLVEVWGRGENT